MHRQIASGVQADTATRYLNATAGHHQLTNGMLGRPTQALKRSLQPAEQQGLETLR